MRARVLLWFCLGLNVLLAAMVVILARDSQQEAAAESALAAQEIPVQFKTNVVLRRQAFTWAEVESPDYHTYIANLRRIGCPAKTIRDIVVADVNDLYADRISKEIVFPEQKWWLPDPDAEALEAGLAQVRALEAEKNRLLTDLLGPDWAKSGSAATMAALEARQGLYSDALRFDGPILGQLSPEVKASVRQIEQKAAQIREELLARARAENRTPTAGELQVLAQETRRQLAGVLTNDQLEEYMLRYSPTAERMRDELRGFGTNADEFRRIFRVRDAYNQQLAAVEGSDAAAVNKRAEIERMRDASLRQELGPDRFALYQLTQDPLFRQAQEQAQQSGASAEKVLPIFRINQAVQAEIARVQADRTITEDQRKIALVTIQQQQQNSIQRVLTGAPAEPLAEAAVVTPAPAPFAAVPQLPPVPPGLAQ